MTPRYELLAVRLNGEIYPAVIDHNDGKQLPFIFYAKDRPGYAEFMKLMAEYRGHQMLGLSPSQCLDLPHYLSEETYNKIRDDNAGAPKLPPPADKVPPKAPLGRAVYEAIVGKGK